MMQRDGNAFSGGRALCFFSLLRGLVVVAWQQFLAVKLLQFEGASENRECKAKFKKITAEKIMFFGGAERLDFGLVS